jgi:hypothetical protein
MIRILPPINLVAGITEIPNDQFMAWEARLDERLQPPVMLHPLGQRIADDANVVSLLKLQRSRLRDGG